MAIELRTLIYVNIRYPRGLNKEIYTAKADKNYVVQLGNIDSIMWLQEIAVSFITK